MQLLGPSARLLCSSVSWSPPSLGCVTAPRTRPLSSTHRTTAHCWLENLSDASKQSRFGNWKRMWIKQKYMKEGLSIGLVLFFYSCCWLYYHQCSFFPLHYCNACQPICQTFQFKGFFFFHFHLDPNASIISHPAVASLDQSMFEISL